MDDHPDLDDYRRAAGEEAADAVARAVELACPAAPRGQADGSAAADLWDAACLAAGMFAKRPVAAGRVSSALRCGDWCGGPGPALTPEQLADYPVGVPPEDLPEQMAEVAAAFVGRDRLAEALFRGVRAAVLRRLGLAAPDELP